MDLIKVRVHIDHDGLLKLEVPTDYQNVELEVALVLNPIQKNDYLPDDFFDQLDAIEADDLIERPTP